jgi:GNAT superfamily N-acetyltransferase
MITKLKLIKTDSQNSDFIRLVEVLDQYLKTVDGDDHAFYNSYNGLESIKNVVVAYVDNEAVGCGAFKEYDEFSVEIKRMFVNPNQRGTGLGSAILVELENWAKDFQYKKIILETGQKQTEAISLYKKQHYKIIPNYGQYKNVENSICFEKVI